MWKIIPPNNHKSITELNRDSGMFRKLKELQYNQDQCFFEPHQDLLPQSSQLLFSNTNVKQSPEAIDTMRSRQIWYTSTATISVEKNGQTLKADHYINYWFSSMNRLKVQIKIKTNYATRNQQITIRVLAHDINKNNRKTTNSIN